MPPLFSGSSQQGQTRVLQSPGQHKCVRSPLEEKKSRTKRLQVHKLKAVVVLNVHWVMLTEMYPFS